MNLKQREEERRHRGLDTHRISWLPGEEGGRGRQREKDRGIHVNNRNPYSKSVGERRRRGSSKCSLMRGCTDRGDEKNHHVGRRKTGEHLEGKAAARYIEHAIGKWRGCMFACDTLLRHATQSKTGHYANVRRLRRNDLHFTCSAAAINTHSITPNAGVRAKYTAN